MDQLRPIRSFVRRQGRMTPKQEYALEHLWPRYGYDLSDQIDWKALFPREAEVVLEIGFGMGDALATMAANYPDVNYLGIEVHQPGVGALLHKCHEHNLSNVRVFSHDVNDVIAAMPDNFLSKVFILFPDPWPKKRHNKRRLVQTSFIDALCKKMKPQAQLHLATDWAEYAQHMLDVCENISTLANAFGKRAVAPLQYERIETKFERRGAKLGHHITDLAYIKTA